MNNRPKTFAEFGLARVGRFERVVGGLLCTSSEGTDLLRNLEVSRTLLVVIMVIMLYSRYGRYVQYVF